MGRITPFLRFDGWAEEATRFDRAFCPNAYLLGDVPLDGPAAMTMMTRIDLAVFDRLTQAEPPPDVPWRRSWQQRPGSSSGTNS